MLIAGLDEAGRGPVLGSMTIGCVIFSDKTIHILEDIGVDDSKKISAKKRKMLAEQIRSHCVESKVLEITAADINLLHKKGFTLNQIEEMNFANLINSMENKPDEIYLDAADVIEERFGQSIGRRLKFKPKKIISKHKGDAIFKIVGAASILAKTDRDNIIDGFKEEYGNVGSGYPSDPYTRKFLKQYYTEHQSFPPFVRTWWKTAEKIAEECSVKKGKKKQSKLPF